MSIVWKRRHVGGYRYHNCEECRHSNTIQKPVELSMPYCGKCGMSIEDAAHKYCGWCGFQLESEKPDKGLYREGNGE
jgi:transcription initiation factor TFIIIB Brf1 subunit/transcription initiation factor TFIIB